MHVSLGVLAGWLLRLLWAYGSYFVSQRSFRATRAPRRTVVRAGAVVLAIAVVGAFFVGRVPDRFCIPGFRAGGCGLTDISVGLGDRASAAAFWLALVGVPAFVGMLVGGRRRAAAALAAHIAPELQPVPARRFFDEYIIGGLVAGGGGWLIWLLLGLRFGGWGFALGWIGMFIWIAAVLAVLFLLRYRGKPVHIPPE